MRSKTTLLWAKRAVIAATVPVLLWAFAAGPDPGNSGVPGESTCAACHVGTAVNGGPGSVNAEFSNGQTYSPGATQRIAITVSDEAQRRFGFQITARLASDATTQAGSFTAVGGETQVLCSQRPFTAQQRAPCPANLPLQYAEHTSEGSRSGRNRYEVDWTAPATDVGPITFYLAGNAANGNGTNTGDRIYTRTFTLTPSTGGGGGPLPTITSVVNGASFQPGIAAGSWVTIRGTNLAPATRTWRTDEIVNGRLPTSLDGVSVRINNRDAAVYFISPTQLNVQAPSDGAAGDVQVTVTTPAGTSAPGTATLQAFAPAFFLWQERFAVATRPDFTWIGPPNLFPGQTTTPARPGEVVILWGTGFGATAPEVLSGTTVTGAPTVTNNPTVRMGGAGVEFLGAALSPGSAGLYQIAVRVPDSAPDGDLPVVAELGGFRSPDNVFITVRR
jgi:uncharacterized protein (TIGR03437 family)